MKSTKWVIHAILSCQDCKGYWDNYKTAQTQARLHAQKTGHVVRGEVGYGIRYDGRNTILNQKAKKI